MKFKPYKEYKKVDLPWIDEIPSHWEMKKIKYIFSERNERGKEREPLLVASQRYGVILKSMYESRTVEAQRNLESLKYVNRGDFVISLRSFQGGIEYAYYSGIISPAYTIMIPKEEIRRKYFKHLAKSYNFIKLLQTCVTGIREGQNIDYNKLRSQKIFLPPKEEQYKIADFLDHNLANIDKFVGLTERKIELLKEQKEILINNAVTKGIDKNVEYKDSGIDWIGEIPEHWEVIRLKRILISNESGNWGEEPLNNTDDIYVLRSTEQNYDGSWRIDWSEVAVRNIANICEKYILKKEDLLLTKSSGSFNHIGKVSIVTEDIEKKNVTFSNFMQKLRVDKNNYPYYYWIILNSNVVKQQYRILSTTTTGLSNLNLDNIKNIIVTLPPKQEQEEIVAYIEEETNKIDRTIDLYKRQIELIKEYRTSLIASAVTGKIDVRDF